MTAAPVFLEITPATRSTANRIFRHICAHSSAFVKFPRVNELSAVVVAGEGESVVMVGIDQHRLTTDVITTDTATLDMVATVQDYATKITA